MISGQWFFTIEVFLRIGQILHKITHNSMKNSTLTNWVSVHPTFEANPYNSLREIENVFNWNRKNRSQRLNLNKLETRSLGDSPNQIWMISGQWFYRFLKNWLKNCTKLAIIPLKIWVAPCFHKLSKGLPKEHPQKIWSKSVKWFERRTTTTTMEWSLNECE